MTWLMFVLIMGQGRPDTSQAVAEFHTKLGCDTAALAVGTQYQDAMRRASTMSSVLILCVPNAKLTM